MSKKNKKKSTSTSHIFDLAFIEDKYTFPASNIWGRPCCEIISDAEKVYTEMKEEEDFNFYDN